MGFFDFFSPAKSNWDPHTGEHTDVATADLTGAYEDTGLNDEEIAKAKAKHWTTKVADDRARALSMYNEGARPTPTVAAPAMGKAAGYAGATLGPASLAAGPSVAAEGRDAQIEQLKRLQARATGASPSLAALQLKQGLEANMKAQQAAAASAKGGVNSALLLRNLGMSGTNANMATNQAAAKARLEEMLGAEQMYGSAAGGLRSGDIATSKLMQDTELANQAAKNAFAMRSGDYAQQAGLFNAGAQNDWEKYRANLGMQAGLANQGAQMGMYGMTDAQRRFAMGQMNQMTESERSAALQKYAADRGLSMEGARLQFAKDEADSNRTAGYVSAGAMALAMMASDEKVKNMKSASAGDVANAFVKGMSAGKKMSDDPFGPAGMMASMYKPGAGDGSGASTSADAAAAPALTPWEGTPSRPHPLTAWDGGDEATAAENAILSGQFAGNNGLGATNVTDPGLDQWPGYAGTGAPMHVSPLAAMSDENQKKMADHDEMDRFLSSLKAHAYTYKNPDQPGAGHGTYVSPTAQEFEKTPLGAQGVVNTPSGKMVDYGALQGVQFAAIADINDRLRAIESGKRKKKVP